MKTLPTAVTAQMVAQQKRPVLLFDLGLSGNTLYYVADRENIIFGGNTYSAKAITVSDFSQSAEGQINRITLNFDNVNRDMAAYATYIPFEGRPLLIKRIYRDAMSGTTLYNEVFRGTMEELTDIGRTWMPINATSGKPLYQKALLKEYNRNCNYLFGDVDCNRNEFSDLTSAANYAEGQILSGATNYMVIDTTTGSVTGTNDDAFNYGLIKIGKSGTTYIRTCYDWTSGTSRADWQVGLPISLNNTYRYQIYKGCPKDLNSCTAAYAWGPCADNRINFSGFIHIGLEKQDITQLSRGAELPQYYIAPPPERDDTSDSASDFPDRDEGDRGGMGADSDGPGGAGRFGGHESEKSDEGGFGRA